MRQFLITVRDEPGDLFMKELDEFCDDWEDCTYEEVEEKIPDTLRDGAPRCTVIDMDPEWVEEDPRPSLGDLVEIHGFEYVVYSANIEGEIHLIPRDELVEDHTLA